MEFVSIIRPVLLEPKLMMELLDVLNAADVTREVLPVVAGVDDIDIDINVPLDELVAEREAKDMDIEERLPDEAEAKPELGAPVDALFDVSKLLLGFKNRLETGEELLSVAVVLLDKH
jgi:hypothetical protein